MASPNFVPKRTVITNITQANPGVVTATAHGYSTGDVVTINIPRGYGMDAARFEAEITVIDADTFSYGIDTQFMAAFVTPGAPYTSAEVLPVSAETDNIAT